MLVTAILAKDEANRFLRPVLERCRSFSDTVLVLDDRSTDATPQIATELGCEVQTRSILADPAWGKESSARQELWDWAAEVAGADGWVLICDADMVLHGDPRPYTQSWEMNSWAWPLADLWDSDTTHRVDGPWAMGPRTPRPWLFKPSAAAGLPLQFGRPDAMGRSASYTPQWGDRGIHVGHCPGNFPLVCGVATDLLWLHYAYLRPEDRQAKYQQYLSVQDQLSPFERAHAESIIA